VLVDTFCWWDPATWQSGRCVRCAIDYRTEGSTGLAAHVREPLADRLARAAGFEVDVDLQRLRRLRSQIASVRHEMRRLGRAKTGADVGSLCGLALGGMFGYMWGRMESASIASEIAEARGRLRELQSLRREFHQLTAYRFGTKSERIGDLLYGAGLTCLLAVSAVALTGLLIVLAWSWSAVE
jgi:hypothetical protein